MEGRLLEVEGSLIWALQAARRALAAFSSETALVIVVRELVAISFMLPSSQNTF